MLWEKWILFLEKDLKNSDPEYKKAAKELLETINIQKTKKSFEMDRE